MGGDVTVALVGAAPGAARRRAAVQVLRVVSWAVPAVCSALAVISGAGIRWAFGAGAVVATAVACAYRRFFADFARASSLPTVGSLEVTADHLVVRHAGVLATDIAIPWAVVRAVCIDNDEVPRRFVLPAEDGEGTVGRPVALFGPSRRRRGGGVPLLAASSVVPNVLVLVEPPVEVPWRYPFVVGPFNPPWGPPWPARPWPVPALTPAFLVALADPSALAASAAAHAPVRALIAADGRYLAAGGLLD